MLIAPKPEDINCILMSSTVKHFVTLHLVMTIKLN